MRPAPRCASSWSASTRQAPPRTRAARAAAPGPAPRAACAPPGARRALPGPRRFLLTAALGSTDGHRVPLVAAGCTRPTPLPIRPATYCTWPSSVRCQSARPRGCCARPARGSWRARDHRHLRDRATGDAPRGAGACASPQMRALAARLHGDARVRWIEPLPPPRPPLTTRRDRLAGSLTCAAPGFAVLAPLGGSGAPGAPAAPAPAAPQRRRPAIVVAFANAPQGTPAPAGTTGTR